jgi:hypothetical protein
VADDDGPPLMDISDDKDDDEEDHDNGRFYQEVGSQKAHNSDIDNNEGHTQHTQNANRFIIGDGYRVKLTVRIQYNNKYTTAQAGQSLMHQESRDCVYGATLGSGDNPWAPFNSKKDWEITRWAKLQGAGSTVMCLQESERCAVHYNNIYI